MFAFKQLAYNLVFGKRGQKTDNSAWGLPNNSQVIPDKFRDDISNWFGPPHSTAFPVQDSQVIPKFNNVKLRDVQSASLNTL
jgi:hypothetical protein